MAAKWLEKHISADDAGNGQARSEFFCTYCKQSVGNPRAIERYIYCPYCGKRMTRVRRIPMNAAQE